MENENNPEENLEAGSSPEEQTPTEVREDEKTPVENAIPYDRFKEVIEEKNDLKNDIEALRGEMASLKSKEPEEEPADWQEAEKRTVNKATAQMRAEFKAEEDKDRAEELEIEGNFDQLKKVGQEITPEIKKAVLSEMIRSGKGVIDTYLDIKDKVVKDTKTEQLKTEGQIPSSQKGSEDTPSFNYKDIRAKSLDDIMDEAA